MSDWRVLNADCLTALRDFAPGSFDAVITDIPYGTTSCDWDSVIPLVPMWESVKRLLRPGGPFVTTASQPFTSALVMSNPRMFKYEWIWHKSKCGSAFTAKYRPQAKHENVLVFGRGTIHYYPQMEVGKAYRRVASGRKVNNHKLGITVRPAMDNKGTRFPSTVQFFQQDWRRQDQIHPTQKPVALYRYLVNTYTNAGDSVLDLACGSGTTGVACAELGRDFVGVELDPGYCEIARRRIAAAQAQGRLFTPEREAVAV
jgi:site-specific DNA-methyltransferase (adenine-specific)